LKPKQLVGADEDVPTKGAHDVAGVVFPNENACLVTKAVAIGTPPWTEAVIGISVASEKSRRLNLE
jgi:hypothetical protein